MIFTTHNTTLTGYIGEWVQYKILVWDKNVFEKFRFQMLSILNKLTSKTFYQIDILNVYQLSLVVQIVVHKNIINHNLFSKGWSKYDYQMSFCKTFIVKSSQTN